MHKCKIGKSIFTCQFGPQKSENDYRYLRLNNKCLKQLPVPTELKGQCHENLILTGLWGFRLGPTDVPHPLLTSVQCTLSL